MIKKKSISIDIFEIFILLYCLIQPLILKWIINKSYVKYIYILIILYYIIKMVKIKKVKVDVISIVLITLSYIYILLNLQQNGFGKYYYTNLVICGFGNIIILSFFINNVMKKDNSLIDKIIRIYGKVSNLYFIINIPIILIQMQNNYFMMRHHEVNPMYEDHITGLIGASGTHRLTFFWLTLIIANIYFYNKNKNKSMLIWIIAQLIFMVSISVYNDNTAFFVFFPIILLQVMIIFIEKINIIRVIKFLIIIPIFVSIITATYNSNDKLQVFFNDRVMGKYYQLTNQSHKHTRHIEEEEERIQLYKYALEHGNGYKLGKGIGSVTYGDKNMPSHFGMSEISIKTYEGGIIYLVLLILLYSYYSYRLILSKNNPNRKNKLCLMLIMVFNFTIMSIYTQIFSTPEIIIFLGITLCVVSMIYQDKINMNKLKNTYPV